MSKFNIEISSVPDREKLVAEIWYGKYLIAELNQENDPINIELYPTQKIVFNYQEFIKILEAAKKKLIS